MKNKKQNMVGKMFFRPARCALPSVNLCRRRIRFPNDENTFLLFFHTSLGSNSNRKSCCATHIVRLLLCVYVLGSDHKFIVSLSH